MLSPDIVFGSRTASQRIGINRKGLFKLAVCRASSPYQVLPSMCPVAALAFGWLCNLLAGDSHSLSFHSLDSSKSFVLARTLTDSLICLREVYVQPLATGLHRQFHPDFHRSPAPYSVSLLPPLFLHSVSWQLLPG